MKFLALRSIVLATCAFLFAVPAFAQLDWRKSGPPPWATPEDIAAATHLRHLCLFISGFNEAPPNSSNYRYEWQMMFVRAVGAEGPIDTPAESERVQRIWKRFEDHDQLVCASAQFDVHPGSILKYAAVRGFDAFVNFAAEHKLGLTKVDKDDGRTILDYLQYHIQRTRGSETEKQLRGYYAKLRKAGAKHQVELP